MQKHQGLFSISSFFVPLTSHSSEILKRRKTWIQLPSSLAKALQMLHRDVWSLLWVNTTFISSNWMYEFMVEGRNSRDVISGEGSQKLQWVCSSLNLRAHALAGDASVWTWLIWRRTIWSISLCKQLCLQHVNFLGYIYFVKRLGDSSMIVWRPLFMAQPNGIWKKRKIHPFLNHLFCFSVSIVSRRYYNNLELLEGKPYPDCNSSLLCPGNFTHLSVRIHSTG